MKTNTVKRHIREGFKSLGRNGWMTFASISAVTITLMLVGTFLSIIMNVDHMAKSLEQDVEIHAYVDVIATPEEHDQIKNDIEKLDGVDSIVFSSKEEELEKLKDNFGDSAKALELIEQDNPLHDTFIVKPKNPQEIGDLATEIEKVTYITKVNYGQESVEKLFDVVNTIRSVGIVLIIGLLFTAMFLISNTIKVTIFARKDEIEIMRLVGAKNSFIRWPFLLEGLLLGVLGSIIPIIFVLTTYQSSYSMLADKTNNIIQLMPLFPYALVISLILLLIGGCIGMWGSVMSIRKFLKK
ncbi:permease-like cell division protein FtsX [Priestia taiwanensis]|uniref:Cell division protein FtsX n=1 Tax=Priestia taiwanensis TaxID=1347902 RepID=A0A917AW13_9BACI|nr:permease-like cell division protein FtsX [Priestia taiwanensis]MBM7364400.1 cell division transport system permease protein [Priestia taiwanensis]GGE81692.1 cell division protein FtsX [Priestia taiwanensis]